MSRAGAALGSGFGAMFGFIGGAASLGILSPKLALSDRDEESVVLIGVGVGAMIGAAIGAGSGCTVVTKTVGTGGECTPLLSDPGLPFLHNARFP